MTIVAISGYVAHMWVRNRTLTRAADRGPDDGPVVPPDLAPPGEAR